MHAIVIGAGPAGLMAAQVLAEVGVTVAVYDRMPSVGRKFLLAGRGGLNLTHSEPLAAFLQRYGESTQPLASLIEAFPPEALRDWSAMLGVETFVGSSGRVFPNSFKTSPLLRAWLARLVELGVSFNLRTQWLGWDSQGRALLQRPDEAVAAIAADAVVLALGGASWPRLGSDGGWAKVLTGLGVDVRPLVPANCGIEIAWTPHLIARHAGAPLKRIALSVGDQRVAGEAVLTATGLEGGAVYALVPALRPFLATGNAALRIDLRPDLDETTLASRLAQPRGSQSHSNHLRKAAGLAPAAIALLHETGALPANADALAARIKALMLPVTALRPIERAISSAGGIVWDAVTPELMLKAKPGTFIAGEMLDWEAPTGGYLLQAVFATGHAAGRGALAWLRRAA